MLSASYALAYVIHGKYKHARQMAMCRKTDSVSYVAVRCMQKMVLVITVLLVAQVITQQAIATKLQMLFVLNVLLECTPSQEALTASVVRQGKLCPGIHTIVYTMQ